MWLVLGTTRATAFGTAACLRKILFRASSLTGITRLSAFGKYWFPWETVYMFSVVFIPGKRPSVYLQCTGVYT